MKVNYSAILAISLGFLQCAWAQDSEDVILKNFFNITKYNLEDGTPRPTFFVEGKTPLPESVGWVVVLAFGFAFSLFTTALVYMDYHFGSTAFSSEQFNTAGRSIKTGLTASVIVSQWTWAATLLQSSNVAFKYGISGPFWYASGATIQVILFAALAVQVKLKAPTAHTILEIVRARWGTTAHIVFFVFCLLTNCIVTSMLILGGAAVVTALTGMNIQAAAMLIPIGVVFYTAAGGLKATFMASYVHTSIIYIVLVIFTMYVYASSGDELLGSPGKVYDNLNTLFKGEGSPRSIPDNRGGHPLTMLSEGGLIFGVINIIGNFGTVFVDQAYWQSAIAAKPSATHKGYFLGGMCWFAIPFTLATSMGMAALALDLPITADEAGSGLVPPAVAVHVAGKGGAAALLVMLFMAVTSTGSAEQIAVSSLIAYDGYRTYINPKATGQQIVNVSRVAIVVYGILSGIFAIILQEIGLNLGWVYLFMGIVIGSAVFPIALCVTWNKTSAVAAITAAVVGQVCAVITWLVVCATEFDGDINVKNLGADYPMLAGNMVAICVSGIVCIVMSYIFPQDFDWVATQEIPMIEQDGSAELAKDGEDSREAMEKALKFTTIYGLALSLVLILVWPVLTIPAGVFTKGYFTFWVIIALAWGWIAALFMVILPVWESKDSIFITAKYVLTCSTTKSRTAPTKEVE